MTPVAETPHPAEAQGRVIITWPAEAQGRVIITWPADRFGVVDAMCIRVTDADSGEEFVDGTSISISHGSPGSWEGGALEIEMTRLTHEDGTPLGSRPVHFVNGEVPVGRFRYVVAEMRVAES